MSLESNIKKQYEISILVPICNVEKYLVQCLNSIVEQSFHTIEIILINDGSKDSSLKIIKEFASKDDRIVVIDKPNTGYGHSMNIGLSRATGRYIGIVESDDWIEKDMFEKLYSIAEKDKLDVVRSEFFFYSTKNGVKNKKSDTFYVPHNKIISPRTNASVFMQQPSIWSNLYLKSFLDENNIRFLETPGASYQDTAFSFKVYACAKRFEMVENAFYHYRIDGGSSSFQHTTKVYCVCDEYNEIWSYVKQHDMFDQYKHIIAKMQFNTYKWNFNRLAKPYCDLFFNKWHEEFIKLNENHCILFEEFSGFDKQLLDDVLLGKEPDNTIPLVSIIVPVYNVADYLSKCLDSLINQTLTNIEIICVNDGSTDNSAEILDYYSKQDSRIKIITKTNGGLSSARNAGIKVARAEYIGFVDSDDWVEPDTYEVAYVAMKDSDVVCFGTNVVGEAMMDRRKDDMEYYRIKYNGFQILTDEMRLKTDVAAWNKLYSLDIIKENGLEFPVGKLYEDYSFYWRYIIKCKTAHYIPDYKYNYLRREGSIMAQTFSGNQRSIEHLEIFPEIFNFISSNGQYVNRRETVNSMFLNCFWFAYLNVPLNMKKKVMKLGTKQVKCLQLSGNPVLEALRNKEYDKVDKHKNYTFVYRCMTNWLDFVEHMIGGDLKSLKKMMFGTYRKSFDKSDSVATTEWVYRHELAYGVERWITQYDCNSSDTDLNWGYSGGIVGNSPHNIIDARKSVFQVGTELKITATLWGAEITVLSGPILGMDRAIWGNAIYDGSSTFVLSVDMNPTEGIICARAISLNTNEDISQFCKILKIESRIY